MTDVLQVESPLSSHHSLEDDLIFHVHTFDTRRGDEMVLDAPGRGCIVIDGHLLRGGRPVGSGLWLSVDLRWSFRLSPCGDLLVEGLWPELRCRLTVRSWSDRWTSAGRGLGIELQGVAPAVEALDGGDRVEV